MKMKVTIIFLLLAVASSLGFAQTQPSDTLAFQSLSHNFAGTSLGYRKAKVLCADTTTSKALIIYLHGGSSCGTDNTTQMNEPGIDSIANYLVIHGVPSVFIVPQCPDRNKGWGGIAMNVKALLDFTAHVEDIDTTRIYIFGGSMGGTGTWKMLSTFPGYFSGAMACAANPKGMVAENVAKTPVYNVMGLADKIMNGDVRAIAEDFINQLKALGDDVQYETVEGWSHEVTCIQSYTAARLDWVFSHRKTPSAGITTVTADCTINPDTNWYTLQGQIISQPTTPGIYIHQGKKILVTGR